MKIHTHLHEEKKIAELISDKVLITNVEDGLQLLVDLYYQNYDKILLYEKNVISDFFDLKNGLAGEILQKFSNYRMQLVIIGDFNQYKNKSLTDFIFESNKGRLINFLPSLSAARERF